MLTRSVAWNAAAALSHYGAKVVVTLVMAPLIIGHLGAAAYGAWQMLIRVAEHLAITDGRANEALKWHVNASLARGDDRPLAEWVGAATAVWLLCLPLFVLCSGAVLMLLPQFIAADAGTAMALRWTLVLVLAATVAEAWKSFPGSVLFALNISWRDLGGRMLSMILAGVAMAAAVYAGYGLPGIAAGHALGAVIGMFLTFWITRRHVQGWGVARPQWPQVRQMFGLSRWFASWLLVEALLLAGDALVLGAVVGAEAVAHYTVSCFAVQSIAALALTAMGAVAPGIGAKLKEGLSAAAEVRAESMRYLAVLTTTAGAVVLIGNASFVSLWVGAGSFVGQNTSLLIVLSVLALTLLRAEGSVVNLGLQMRRKTLFGMAGAVLSLALGAVLAHFHGIAGLCVGILVGRALLCFVFSRLAGEVVGEPRALGWCTPRLVGCCVLVLTAAQWLGSGFHTENLWWLLAGSALAGLVSFVLLFMLALRRQERIAVSDRLKSIFAGWRWIGATRGAS